MEKFCLKWSEYHNNIGAAFIDLRAEQDFFDVTLACEDSQVEAHKVVLSACSPFFRNILKRNPHQHPLIYLRGVQYKDLTSILDFMYQGQVNIAQTDLNSFLTVAEELKIKGLVQKNGQHHHQPVQPMKSSPPPPPLVAKPKPKIHSVAAMVEDDEEVKCISDERPHTLDQKIVLETTPAKPEHKINYLNQATHETFNPQISNPKHEVSSPYNPPVFNNQGL